MKEIILEIASNIKICVMVAIYSIGSGTALSLNFIRGNIAEIATISGIILTWCLIFINIKKYKSEKELMELKKQEILMVLNKNN